MRWLVFLWMGWCAVSAWAGHAYSQFGDIKYPPGFKHFAYVQPDAPKGGRIRFPMIGGGFDKLNPFTLKGVEPPGLEGLMFDTLLSRSLDEPASAYGLLAHDISVASDGRSAEFELRPEARFHNGDPVLALDVKHSFDKLSSKESAPQYRMYFSGIASVTVLGDRKVRFEFREVNRELPLVAGNLPVFSHRWGQGKPLDQLINEVPIGSGPYQLAGYNLGKDIRFKRDPSYWGRDLPVNRGLYNFDHISFDGYKDPVAAFEAFKAGEFDFIQVYIAKDWARQYKGGKFATGELVKREWQHANPVGFQGFLFNTRLPKFADARVRRAIGLALDYEWMNRQIFYQSYTRVRGYFTNSPFEAKGLPLPEDLALLRSLKQPVPAAVLTSEVPTPPVTTAPSSLRDNLRLARELLSQAGWEYRDGALRNAKGEKFTLEFLDSAGSMGRVVAPYKQTLAKLGIEASYRVVDPSVYEKRIKDFTFEMISSRTLGQLTPGSELRRYESQYAMVPGSSNLPGVADPVVDELVQQVMQARDRPSLTVAVRSLDRVLRHGYYDVPHWYSPVHRVAYHSGLFEQPAQTPLYYQPEPWAMSTWWATSASSNAPTKP
ncbi:MAG: extracellular solute-binding protein [Limnohabitans sp.]